MTHTDFYVYTYKHPDTEKPFYIGKGRENRFMQHMSDNEEKCFNKRLTGTIRNIKETGKKPIIVKLHENLDEETALAWEDHYVKLYGRKGIDEDGILMNIMEGGIQTPKNQGENHPMYGKKHTEESKKKMSETQKRILKENPELHGMLGKTHTEESKEKNRQSHLGKKASQETRDKISKARSGKKHPEGTGEKIADKLSKMWLMGSPEGNYHIITNLNKWSKENGLDQGNLVKVASGISKQHKGWTCSRLADREMRAEVVVPVEDEEKELLEAYMAKINP
jgi:hypothetical protein